MSVCFAFCHRIRWSQNMRSSGESSQRSCSRKRNSFENTSPPPRLTKDGRAWPIHAVWNSLGTWKRKEFTSLASVLRVDPLDEEADTWKLYLDDHFISLPVLMGERSSPSSQSFLTGDSKKGHLPTTAVGFSYTLLDVIQIPKVCSSNTKHFTCKPFVANERKTRCVHSVGKHHR